MNNTIKHLPNGDFVVMPLFDHLVDRNWALPTMSRETARRIRTAIAECDAYIAKEAPRAADLRPPEIAKRLAFYIKHRAHLATMLQRAERTPA